MDIDYILALNIVKLLKLVCVFAIGAVPHERSVGSELSFVHFCLLL